MDSNYYNEERMLNEIEKALEYDSDKDSLKSFNENLNLEGELTEKEVNQIHSKFEPISIEEYKKLGIDSCIGDLQLLGWSKFFDKYVKIHYKVQNTRSAFMVRTETFLLDNFKILKDTEGCILRFHGSKLNYLEEEYPLLSVIRFH